MTPWSMTQPLHQLQPPWSLMSLSGHNVFDGMLMRAAQWIMEEFAGVPTFDDDEDPFTAFRINSKGLQGCNASLQKLISESHVRLLSHRHLANQVIEKIAAWYLFIK
ncbi:unnamed protein product [Urochloa humidicola]